MRLPEDSPPPPQDLSGSTRTLETPSVFPEDPDTPSDSPRLSWLPDIPEAIRPAGLPRYSCLGGTSCSQEPARILYALVSTQHSSPSTCLSDAIGPA